MLESRGGLLPDGFVDSAVFGGAGHPAYPGERLARAQGPALWLVQFPKVAQYNPNQKNIKSIIFLG